MMCNCIAEVNKHLAEHNTEITLPLIGRQQPFIQTNKINEKTRGKSALLFATCCPFCGAKYPNDGDQLAAAKSEGAK